MRFCMLTTFFGRHSFGGDAAFVDRLSRALARQGHEVHVIYCEDAFRISKGGQTPRAHETPTGVVVHALKSPLGPLSPLLTHATGRPHLKLSAIRELVADINPHVVHFHNLSLIGGPGLLLEPFAGAVKLLTVHEHWLVCPLHVLWKRDRAICETPECVSCTLRAGRPPQPWRGSDLMKRGLESLDALICPSLSTRDEHRRRGIDVPFTHLPYFLPDDYEGADREPIPQASRPYFAAVGRLEKIKGFQDAIDAFRAIPDADLRLAGSGGYESALRKRAEGLPNVRFEGRLDAPGVARLLRAARGLIVPSLVHETFGYVTLEAFHEHTPVIARNLGALTEVISQSDGGMLFSTPGELVRAVERLRDDDALRERLASGGRRALESLWSETRHLAMYFDLIERLRDAKGLPRTRRPAPFGRHQRAHGAASIAAPATELAAETVSQGSA